MTDFIISGDWLLTGAPGGQALEKAACAVSGEKIVAVGPADEIRRLHGSGARELGGPGFLVMPGLVNSHTHIAMTCFRGLADDMPLMTWLNEHIFPAEQKLTGEMVFWGAALGCAEMIRSGTTFFSDMYLFEPDVARAVDQSGLRARLGEVLYDFDSPSYGPLENGFEFTREFIARYRSHPLIDIVVMPHAPYTCSPPLWEKAASLARSENAMIVTHLSETQDEVRGIKEKYGQTPVHFLDGLGVLAENLVACHAVNITQEEIGLLAERGVKVNHNPSSNMKLASGVAPVPELIAAGVSVGLGTDGPASSNSLDMFREMDIAAKLQKVARLDPAVLPAHEVLAMATATGARVLGAEGVTGRLAEGFLADIIVLDANQPHLQPLYNPVSHLVYAASGADVVHTMVHGRLLMEDRRLTTLDLEEIYAHMRQIATLMRGRV